MTDCKIKKVPIKGPSRRRLLTDPNPNQISVTASLESTVSSDSSSDRLEKKTRDLPNLSDCHSCGVRINYTNPRERLQPLDSMWRVVLLCKKCYKLVISSELCSYCFLSVADEIDCCKCIDCKRCVHKECVAKYDSELGLGFLVCVDCWIPDAIANSIKVRKRSCRKKEIEPESSDSGLRKPVVAKNVNEVVKGDLNVVESKNVVGSCEQKVVDDAEFAFMLHRAINSSPRMSRYDCLRSSYGDDVPVTCYSRMRIRKKGILVGSGSLDVPIICYYRKRKKGGLSNSGSVDVPLKCYSRRRFRSKDCFHGIPRPSVFVKASDCGSSMDFADVITEDICDPICDTKDLENDKECREICEKCDRFVLKYKRLRRTKASYRCQIEDSSILSV